MEITGDAPPMISIRQCLNALVLLGQVLKRNAELHAIFRNLSVFNPHIEFLDFGDADFLEAFSRRLHGFFCRFFPGDFTAADDSMTL